MVKDGFLVNDMNFEGHETSGYLEYQYSHTTEEGCYIALSTVDEKDLIFCPESMSDYSWHEADPVEDAEAGNTNNPQAEPAKDLSGLSTDIDNRILIDQNRTYHYTHNSDDTSLVFMEIANSIGKHCYVSFEEMFYIKESIVGENSAVFFAGVGYHEYYTKGELYEVWDKNNTNNIQTTLVFLEHFSKDSYVEFSFSCHTDNLLQP